MSTSVYMTMSCSNCGNDVPSGNFCGVCGARLKTKAVFRSTVECQNCGKEVAEGSFCSSCGNKLVVAEPEPSMLDRLTALIQADYFPFTANEKNLMLYLLTKHQCLNEDEEIVCEAPQSHVCALLDVFDGSKELLKEKIRSLMCHASVIYRLPHTGGYFTWLGGVTVSKTTVGITMLPERLKELFDYVEEERKLGIWTKEG